MSDPGPDTTIAAQGAQRGRPRWIATTVAILFGLLYAYYLWVALSDLLAFPDEFFTGTELIAKPWALLIINLAMPLLVFVCAVLLGRRRNPLLQALFFVIGLTIISVVSLDIPYLIVL